MQHPGFILTWVGFFQSAICLLFSMHLKCWGGLLQMQNESPLEGSKKYMQVIVTTVAEGRDISVVCIALGGQVVSPPQFVQPFDVLHAFPQIFHF